MSGAEAPAAPEAPGAGFLARGWAVFPPDEGTRAWAGPAAIEAARLLADPGVVGADLRCGGTWFPGVNLLANDTRGAIAEAGVPPLDGAAVAFATEGLGFSGIAWDRGQLSVCWPGYPRQGAEESPANHRYRVTRDAAHVDGLLRDVARRRFPGEAHGFILGLPLSEADREAAPFVVWEGSHEIIRAALADRLVGVPPADWPRTDVTAAYHAARREVFTRCPRRVVHAPAGGAYVVHRLALHGVAPWRSPAGGYRAVAYFRPDPFPGADPDWWLARP